MRLTISGPFCHPTLVKGVVTGLLTVPTIHPVCTTLSPRRRTSLTEVLDGTYTVNENTGFLSSSSKEFVSVSGVQSARDGGPIVGRGGRVSVKNRLTSV